jgi:hypothetical protein
LKPLELKESSKHFYQREHHDSEDGKVYYTRELHVQVHPQKVVDDVVRSCGYGLPTETEAAFNGLKVDIGIIRNQSDEICGTLEVKQPKRENQKQPSDEDPMTHPKVMTRIVSQMIPLHTIYGVEHVYGILSTYSSWHFFKWVPECVESDDIDESNKEAGGISMEEEDAFCTPQKSKSELRDEKTTRKSPPMSPSPYQDVGQVEEDNEQEEEEDSTIRNIKRGTLYASSVMKSEKDGPKVLRVLAWVLGEMAASPIHHKLAYERDLLYVVQKDDAVGGL